MIRRLLLIAAFVSLSVVATSAQKALFLKPHIGGQLPFGHSVGKSSSFKPRFLDTTDNLGLGLQLRLNEDWSVAAGWSQGNIGWGYIIEVPKRSVDTSYPIPRVKKVSGTYAQRFPLQVFHRLRDVIALPLRVGNQEFYLLNFSLNAFAGLSADYIRHASDFGEESEGRRGTPEGNSISYIEKNRW